MQSTGEVPGGYTRGSSVRCYTQERSQRSGASVGRQPRNQGFLNFFVQRVLPHKNLFLYLLSNTKLQSKIHVIDPRQSFSYNTVRILI
jgi:hypothetical protein